MIPPRLRFPTACRSCDLGRWGHRFCDRSRGAGGASGSGRSGGGQDHGAVGAGAGKKNIGPRRTKTGQEKLGIDFAVSGEIAGHRREIFQPYVFASARQ